MLFLCSVKFFRIRVANGWQTALFHTSKSLGNAYFMRVKLQIVSTWLDCSRLMSDFSGRSREFIKACFFHKTHRFLPLYVLGNRSKTLLLPIMCKFTYSLTASRLRSDGTSPKSHRLNFRILIRQAFLQIRILPFLLQ